MLAFAKSNVSFALKHNAAIANVSDTLRLSMGDAKKEYNFALTVSTPHTQCRCFFIMIFSSRASVYKRLKNTTRYSVRTKAALISPVPDKSAACTWWDFCCPCAVWTGKQRAMYRSNMRMRNYLRWSQGRRKTNARIFAKLRPW
jgi:hypothetical protein